MKVKRVAVIGLGYVGLPTMVAIARSGIHQVVGYDINNERINVVKKRLSPIEDFDVKNFLKKNSLNVAADKSILENSNVFIICVPTPVKNYLPDYSFVKSAIQTITPYIKKNSHIVLESTVNPGTCKDIIIPLLAKKCKLKLGKDYNLAHCPEKINPEDEKWNIYNIDRNIGSVNKKFNKKIAHFYRSYIKANINEVSSLEVAEASKIIENTFRDINIAYVNELAKSFDKLGIDLHETISAASSKPFSFMPHWPGCGVGGHCIGVVPYYLIDKAQKNGFDHKFLKLARKINNSMPQYTVSRLIYGLKEVGLTLSKSKIALLGLSYKKDLADLRESPALEVKKELLKHGAIVKAYDPFVKTDTESLENALKDSVGVILATAHTEFVEKLPKLLSKTKIKVIVDGRNCLNKKIINKYKIIYKGIGR